MSSSGRCQKFKLSASFVDQLQDTPCVGDESCSGRREHDAAPVPYEESTTKFGFEFVHPFGDIRLNGMYALGSGREASFVGDGAEHAELPEIHRRKPPQLKPEPARPFPGIISGGSADSVKLKNMGIGDFT